MLNFLFVIAMHLLPLILILIPFLLLFDVSLKNSSPSSSTSSQNLDILEENLKNLIKENSSSNHLINLTKDLKKNLSSYTLPPKHNIKKYPFFQHIFSLIKNKTKDEKIIKILRIYFPSCATSHLYAMLKSFKVFLNIIKQNENTKQLENSLNKNNLKPTLYFLEQKLQHLLKLSKTATTPKEHHIITLKASLYSLVFASFSEFYSKDLTLSVLNLAQKLSPELFEFWHNTKVLTQNQQVISTSNFIKKN